MTQMSRRRYRVGSAIGDLVAGGGRAAAAKLVAANAGIRAGGGEPGDIAANQPGLINTAAVLDGAGGHGAQGGPLGLAGAAGDDDIGQAF